MSAAVTSATPSACAACARRAALLAAVAGRLERRPRDRQRLGALLSLPDDALARALALPAAPPVPAAAPGAAALCRHHSQYPRGLGELAAPPAVLYLGGSVARTLAALQCPSVAIVGSRSPSDYGREVARALAGGLAASGVCIVSGMAMGIDATVHDAALLVGGPTLAVLPGGVDVPYPAGKRSLHGRLAAAGALVSELPGGTAPWRWTFVARNRIIAALASVTVVVEARERSGTLITAGYAAELGREVAAVPGPVTTSRSDGTNALIRDGAHLVRDARDVLDLLYGVGAPHLPSARPSAPSPRALPRELAALLAHVRAGRDTPEALVQNGRTLDEVLVGLTELELLGRVRRGLAGRYMAVPGG